MTAAVGTQEYAREMGALARDVARPLTTAEVPALEPLNLNERSGNELRPATFDELVGQARLKSLLRRIVAHAKQAQRPLDHMLLVGSAGTGKTTIAMVLANELGRDVYLLKAPVGYDMLAALCARASDGDVCILDEVHLQVSGDRRGLTQAADPETFYHVMEDRRLMTPGGAQPFPAVTFIGATTDAGLLPEPFLARFPLAPQLDPYTDAEMYVLAQSNARALGLSIDQDAAMTFSRACRDIPRQLNTYIRNARSLAARRIDNATAVEIVTGLNSTTLDGLTRDMQGMLTFLLGCRREDAKGNVKYQAGLNTLATALGKSRDSKAVSLYVEPYLIKRGFVAVTPSGRALTDAGVERARRLHL